MLAILFAVCCSSSLTGRTSVGWIFATREHRPGDNDLCNRSLLWVIYRGQSAVIAGQEKRVATLIRQGLRLVNIAPAHARLVAFQSVAPFHELLSSCPYKPYRGIGTLNGHHM